MMPKINVYLPEDLATAVRQADLSVSPICQRALAGAVRRVGEAREAIEALSGPEFDPGRHPELSARLAAQMTPRLRGVLDRARDLADPSPVGSEHLLVGIIDEPNNLAVHVLGFLDVDVPALRQALLDVIGAPERQDGTRQRRRTKPTPSQSGQGGDGGLLDGLSLPARLAVAATIQAAVDLGHDFLGSEHLLLALADQDDQQAGQLLQGVGVRPDAARQAITAALAGIAVGSRQAHRTAARVLADRLDDLSRRLDTLEQRITAGGL